MQQIPLILNKVQLPSGLWVHYFDGGEIDINCGTYYLQTSINNVPWYSELFTVKTIKTAVHPGLIKDVNHQALRFYNTPIKQNYYKCNNLCDVGVINPIDHIIPFVLNVSNIYYDGINWDIETNLVCHDGKSRVELTNDLNYMFDLNTQTFYQNGQTLSSQLFCGIYYLEIYINGFMLYSEHFKIENVTNVPINELYLYTESDTETGFEIITSEENEEIIIDL